MIYSLRDLHVGDRLIFYWCDGINEKGCIKCIVSDVYLDYAIAVEDTKQNYKMKLMIEEFNLHMFRRDIK